MVADLVFINERKDPILRTNERYEEVKSSIICSLGKNFSVNYYTSQPNGRTLNKSINLHTRKENANAVVIDSNEYRLREVIFKDIKYYVQNILQDRENANYVILDCQEAK